MSTPLWQDRTRLLLGDKIADAFTQMHVLILGVGGVGAYAAEALARAGIGHLTLVDGDTIEATNCNRQLPALHSTIGQWKTHVVGQRLQDINPAIELELVNAYWERQDIAPFLQDRHFDYAVDAIDALGPKVEFILECRQRNIPLISSMGSGGKLDPSQIRLTDISRTEYCKLAKAVRQQLRKHQVYKGVEVVFSPECSPPEATRVWQGENGHHRSCVGTISYLPAIFGLYCASAVIRNLSNLVNKTEAFSE